MATGHAAYPRGGATALEHLTGPSRGQVTWLNGPALNISLSSARFLQVSEAGAGDVPDNLVARLLQTDDTYEVLAPEDQPLWVNGVRVSSRILEHRDTIEFGRSGPLSRFRLYRENSPVRKMVADILSDGMVYLRVSRQPVTIRIFLTIFGVIRQLMQETTLLFRGGVVLAMVALSALVYHQYEQSKMLQQRFEKSAHQLEGFAGALTRARDEALTPGDLQSLRLELGDRLSSNAERLVDLERRSKASGRVIAASMASIAFLQGAYSYRESSSKRMLRHIVNDEGTPLISPFGQPLLSLDGDGPVAERQFTGTGFAFGSAGLFITNRHVARPWENDASGKALVDQGLEPVMIKYVAFLPGKTVADEVELLKVSEDADLAVLRLKEIGEPMQGLKLAAASPAPGDEILVLGYPTGLRSMLAQAGESFIEELQSAGDTAFWSVAARLAKKGHIAPLASRGIISQLTSATVIYDAETTHGGSGGPVLDIDGKVVAVNAAIMPDYSGSNMGVPVARVRELLKAAGLH